MAVKFNAFTGNFDIVSDLSGELHLDQTIPQTIDNGTPLLNRTPAQITDPQALTNKEYVDQRAISLVSVTYFGGL